MKEREYIIPKKKIGRGFKGDDVIDREFFNCCLIGKTNSGKTTAILNLLNTFCDKNSIIWFYVPTQELDAGYDEIKRLLDSKEIEYTFEEFSQETFNESIENMKYLLAEEKREAAEEDRKENLPNFFTIFDDVSYDVLRSRELEYFARKSRHYRNRLIISTQSPQITKTLFLQIYMLILFGGISPYYLEHIYKSYPMDVDKDEFIEIYKKVTAEPYKFLTIINGSEFRDGLFK